MPYPNTPPPGYRSPPFPSLNVRTVADPTQDRAYTLYYLGDVWKFTVIWTLIAYALFHCGALLVAAAMRSPRKPPLSWRFVCLVPLVCLVTAGLEALLAGSVVGLMLGAIYHAGYYEMNTWIPCVWGFVNVMVLVVSSFSIQGGL